MSNASDGLEKKKKGGWRVSQCDTHSRTSTESVSASASLFMIMNAQIRR